MDSLASLLGPGDDISYRLGSDSDSDSSPQLSYGRIIFSGSETLTIRRYANTRLDYSNLPEVFYTLQELVQTEDQVTISQDDIEELIFVFSVQQITSHWYDVEGIQNCFFVRGSLYFPLGMIESNNVIVPCLLIIFPL